MDPYKLHKLIRNTSLAGALDEFAQAATLANRSDQFVYANPAFTKMYGWSEEEIIGLKPTILVPRNFSKSELSRVRKKISEARIAWSGGLINRHKDGTIFTIELAAFQVSSIDSLGPNLFLGISTTKGRIEDAKEELTTCLCRSLFGKDAGSATNRQRLHILRKPEQITLLKRYGYSTKEIADFLGVELNTPNVILHRARRKSM